MERITLLGDSQVRRMIKTLIDNHIIEPSCVNYAVGGLCVAELKRVVRRRVQTFKDICFVLISINDILKNIPLNNIKNNIKVTVGIIIKNQRSVIVSTLPPVLNASESVSAKITDINVFILSLQTSDRVRVISLHEHFHPFKPINKQLYQRRYHNNRTDNIHLSSQGHLLLASLISNAIPSQGTTPAHTQ